MPSQEPQPGRSMSHCDTRSQGCLSGMYGPALLFHQQYPTTMCGKVTTRTAPADTVPTVTDWQLNRAGTVYRPTSGGDGAGWMGNTCARSRSRPLCLVPACAGVPAIHDVRLARRSVAVPKRPMASCREARQGLTILARVALWRPGELRLDAWDPLTDQRAHFNRNLRFRRARKLAVGP
jgi:hypothetical protein